jgi:RNA-directed DNA polymerase
VRLPGATHLVLGFQYRTDAEQFLREFQDRLAKFGLELHSDKTRLIEFGRFAARIRAVCVNAHVRICAGGDQ